MLLRLQDRSDRSTPIFMMATTGVTLDQPPVFLDSRMIGASRWSCQTLKLTLEFGPGACRRNRLSVLFRSSKR